jgi:hypothetical protein
MRLHTWCVVLLAVPLSACEADGDSSSCEFQVSKRLEVEPADASLKFHLERCRVDVDACPELCQVALTRINLNHTVNSCTVGFVGEIALLDVVYSVPNEKADCFFDDFGGEPVAFKRGAR